MQSKTALVAGAQGVIGRNLIAHLEAEGGWDIIGLSRRGGEAKSRTRHIAVDLLDSEDALSKLGPLANVTHVFYVAYQERGSWAELVAPNMTMLANLMEAIETASPGLRHVSLMQGYKVYGAHLGPFKTPARETDPPPMPPEFNFEQQQLLEARQQGKNWTWSALRPSVVGGIALGNPMNLVIAIAVYAAISKELGLPLRFPGKVQAYDKLVEVTDAGLLARATTWAATEPKAANQAFNINNGDLFRWNDMWPKIARFFDMEVAAPMQLATVMAAKEPLWIAMIERHGLARTPYKDVSSWPFADFVFSWDYDFFADGSKARRLGFHDGVDTEEMFMRLFGELRRRKIIP